MRTSTGSSACAPTGLTARSWIARSSLTCIASGSSPISSRNRVPPLAAWNSPSLSVAAPVKLPLRWPKNSLSISSGEIAPQFTGTKGPFARAPSPWMRRAITSLPVPDSPWMKTGAWLRASFSACARNCRKAGELPISVRPPGGAAAAEGSSLSAWVTSSRRRLSSTGLVTKSNAPSLSARMAVSMLPNAVMTATGVPGWRDWISSTSSSPSPSGRRMSVRHRR